MIITPARKTADTITDPEIDALYALHDQVVRLHHDDGHGYCTACRLTPAPCPTLRAVQQPSPVDDALTDDDVDAIDAAYRERARLLAWIAATLPESDAVLTPASDVGVPGWMILYLQAHGRQLSWHIAPRDVGLFAALEVVTTSDRRALWGGHSTPEKYGRIGDIVRGLWARCGPECSEAHTYTGRCECAPATPADGAEVDVDWTDDDAGDRDAA